MFEPNTYKNRRNKLKELVGSGVIYLPGNGESPMNYTANEYLFRQDSSFLYYFGIDLPHYDAIIDIDNDKEILFGNDRSLDDMIWMGPDSTVAEKAKMVDVAETAFTSELENVIQSATMQGRQIHYLPQYRHDNFIKFFELFGIHPHYVNNYSSEKLTKAVIEQRSVKSAEEIEQIEMAVRVSYEMNTMAMKLTKPGIYEQEISGALEGLTLASGGRISFPIIFSVHGETLHNHYHGNIMKEGDIAVLDSGAESPLHYASDITRTIPVSGTFTDKQKDIYNIVLKAQMTAIEMMKPGVLNKTIHLKAAEVIASGLKDLGLIKGNIDDAVNQGVHALFMPHGLGHMMGLDVHDMEGLGENLVGYDDKIQRSSQFGLSALRFGKELKPGYVLTVEPGTYFIPRLIDTWKAENKFTEFLNYDKLEDYKDFGGVRIEDDVLVTESGYKVLGKPIPKTVEEVEAHCKE